MKKFFSIIAGLACAILIITFVQYLFSFVFPPPKDLDTNSKEAFEAFIAGMPVTAFLTLLVGYFIGTFIGTIVAYKVSGENTKAPFIIVSGILTFSAVINLAMIKHPVWFWFANLPVYFIAAYLAYRFFAPKEG